MNLYLGYFINLITGANDRNYQVGDLSTLKVGDKVLYASPYNDCEPKKGKVVKIWDNDIISIKIGRRVYNELCDIDTGFEHFDHYNCIYKTLEDCEEGRKLCQADLECGKFTKKEIADIGELYFNFLSEEAIKKMCDVAYERYNKEVKNIKRDIDDEKYSCFTDLLSKIFVGYIDEKILA